MSTDIFKSTIIINSGFIHALNNIVQSRSENIFCQIRVARRALKCKEY